MEQSQPGRQQAEKESFVRQLPPRPPDFVGEAFRRNDRRCLIHCVRLWLFQAHGCLIVGFHSIKFSAIPVPDCGPTRVQVGKTPSLSPVKSQLPSPCAGPPGFGGTGFEVDGSAQLPARSALAPLVGCRPTWRPKIHCLPPRRHPTMIWQMDATLATPSFGFRNP